MKINVKNYFVVLSAMLLSALLVNAPTMNEQLSDPANPVFTAIFFFALFNSLVFMLVFWFYRRKRKFIVKTWHLFASALVANFINLMIISLASESSFILLGDGDLGLFLLPLVLYLVTIIILHKMSGKPNTNKNNLES